MKTKLIFATDVKSYEYWTELPFIPRINDLFNVSDLLMEQEIKEIMGSSEYQGSLKGTVNVVEYRHDDNEFYTELVIWCGEKNK
jgi:hypothetical protein